VDITQLLPLVLEHGNITCPATVCSLLLLSKSVKEALKFCKVPCLKVAITARRASLATTSSDFALWFSQYGLLVRKLSFSSRESGSEEDYICKIFETMVRLAFAGAAAGGMPPGLQSFKADSKFCSQAMLSSLPARSLKSLNLTMTPAQLAARSLPRIFQQFSNLQKLTLESGSHICGSRHAAGVLLPASFFSGLPQSLQTLLICRYDAKCLLDIQHLTSLQTLEVEVWKGTIDGSCLPPSLLSATFDDTPMPTDACSWLSGVQQLTLVPAYQEPPGPLLQFSALKRDQELCLQYEDVPYAAPGAAAWGSLPQLRALLLGSCGEARVEECQAVLEGMARATSLTRVILGLPSRGPCPPLPCGVHIAQLQNLQELVLYDAKSSREDVLHLSKLTQLTTLHLRFCRLDGATTAALLGSLTGLKSLVLVQSFWLELVAGETDAIVPVIKYQLKGLRELSLSVPGVTDASVGLLEGLTQLTKLGVDRLTESSLDWLRQVLVECGCGSCSTLVCPSSPSLHDLRCVSEYYMDALMAMCFNINLNELEQHGMVSVLILW
jgi:hypothetical protein